MIKKLLIALCLLAGINGMTQVIIPSKVIKRAIQNIEEINRGSNLTADSILLSRFYLFPSIKFMDYFEKDTVRFFQKNIIGYNDSLSDIALYSELASDFLGPVRVSAGLTLAYPKTDTNSVVQQKLNRQKFVQRLSTGGGALVFNFVLPVYAYYSKYLETAMTFGPRFSLDPPSFGLSTDRFSQNIAVGTDIQAQVKGIKQVFKFYGALRLGYIAGNSTFYDALQLKDKNRKGFWMNNYLIGINIKDIFTLSYTKFWGSQNVAGKLSGFLTFTVEPGF